MSLRPGLLITPCPPYPPALRPPVSPIIYAGNIFSGRVLDIPKKYFQKKVGVIQFFGNAGKYFWPFFWEMEESQSGEFWDN